MDAEGSSSPTEQAAPPAYEVSQEEFDNKTSRAVEESLSTAVSNVRVVDDDGWPIYDASAFEAVAASFERDAAASSSTSPAPERPRAGSPSDKKLAMPLPVVKPLRVRNRTSLVAQDRGRRSASPASGPHGQSNPSLPILHAPSPVQHDLEPPPPFSPIGRLPNGVPFNDATLQVHPADSRASSPLYSPEPTQPIPSQSATSYPTQSVSTQSPPTAPRRPVQRRVRQSNEYLRDTRGPRSSRMDFDPLTAYTKNSFEFPHAQSTSQTFSATDFYHHAVASQLKPITTPTTRPQTESRTPAPSGASMYTAPQSTPSLYSARPPSHAGHQDIISVIRPGPTQNYRTASQPSTQGSFNLPVFPREQGAPLPHRPPSVHSMDPSGVPQSRYAVSEAQLIRDLYRSRG